MFTFDHVLAVTQRSSCVEPFLTRIERIASAHPKAIVLREKDLSEEEYAALAQQVLSLCTRYGVPCILHTYDAVARSLGYAAIHLPLPLLRARPAAVEGFQTVGVSIHSPEEAQEAAAYGATYLTAGHIFPTACKAGVPPRGLEFLRTVCCQVAIPVYAIGGVTPENAPACIEAGATGVCVMSGLMQCPDPTEWLRTSK